METTTLALAGDVMTGRGIDQVLAHPLSAELYEPWIRDARAYVQLAERASGPIPAPVPRNYLWGDALADIALVAPDAGIANLETAITSASRPWPGKGIHYRMNPLNLPALLGAGIGVFSLANNHVLDWRQEGLLETVRTLRRAGVVAAGAGEDLNRACAPGVVRLDAAHRLLVFSWATVDAGVPPEWTAGKSSAGIALLRDLSEHGLRQVAAAVEQHRRDNDLVLLSIHWGGNWVDEVPQAHRDFARALVDRGMVDLVHGHSSHHPLPFEVHRGRLILYGCGDLINDYEGIAPHGAHPQDLACLYFATLSLESGRLARLRIVPFRRRAFRLVRADAAARASIRRSLKLKEGGFAHLIVWREDGHWILDGTEASWPGRTRSP